MHNMTILHATAQKPSRTKNDDIAAHAGNVFWLLDGATQLTPPAHGCDVSWHVGQLSLAFQRTLYKTPDIALPDLARQAISTVARAFYTATDLNETASQHERPFSTLLLARYDENASRLHYLAVLDSTLAVIGNSKEITVTDPRLGNLNALKIPLALLKNGHGFASEAFKAEMIGTYNTAFARINQPGGWDVIGQDATVIDRALTGSIAIEPDDRILFMSDGFTRAVDTLSLYPSWTALAAATEKQGPAAILEQIRAAERADATGARFPRSSIHDDATVLMVRPG